MMNVIKLLFFQQGMLSVCLTFYIAGILSSNKIHYHSVVGPGNAANLTFSIYIFITVAIAKQQHEIEPVM